MAGWAERGGMMSVRRPTGGGWWRLPWGCRSVGGGGARGGEQQHQVSFLVMVATHLEEQRLLVLVMLLGPRKKRISKYQETRDAKVIHELGGTS